MPGFASDRQLTERVLIPAMMGVIVASMKRLAETNGDGDLPMLDQVQELLTEAMGEPLRDQPDDRVAKLLRRAMRLTEVAMKPNFERQLGVQYLIVAYWTRSLVERGIVSVGSESAFGRAWDIMVQVMGFAWDELEQMEDIAVQGARELGESLETQGYFG